MTPFPIRFLFDFGSPNAYLCHEVLPAIEQRAGASIEYLPILLGGLFKLTNNRSPAEAFRDIPLKRAYDRLEMERFVAKHALSAFRANPHFPVNTLKIMRLAVAAQALDVGPRCIDAMFAAMWEEARNMDDPEQIATVLEAAGLDAATLSARAQDADVKARLVSNTQFAFEHGAFGSPSFLVGDALFFGKDRLGQVEEEIVRRMERP